MNAIPAKTRRCCSEAQPEPVPSGSAPAIVHEVLRSPGQPLDPATRTLMESRFAADFGRVRVHTDALAAESAKAVQARAYTVGHNVVFAANNYAPSSPAGRGLLAHELAHTIQQRKASGAPPSAEPHGTFELSAEAAGREVAHGRRVSGKLPACGIGLSRAPAPPAEIEKPAKPAFSADKRKRTWRRYARAEGQKDAARIRKSGKLSAEDRQEINAKLAFFEGQAKDIYTREVKPVLSQFVPRPEIEMPEKYVGRLSSKERRKLEHRRYLTTAYFSRKLEYEFLTKDAYIKGLQSLLEGADDIDLETMEQIVQERYPNAPWHQEAKQDFLAKLKVQEQAQQARLQAQERAQERQKILPQLPDYWQNQMGALSEQIQPWPVEAQQLAQDLLWKWYELRKQAYPSNPALAIPVIEPNIEATIRKELLSDFEQVLRAADLTIQAECKKNPPGWMFRVHGDPCISLFAPYGRAESALAHLERRLKIFRDEDGVPYRTVFFWVEEYQKQQVPTSMAGRYLELLQARAMLVRAFTMVNKPTPLSGMARPPAVPVAAALGEAALGEAAIPGASSGTRSFPRVNVTGSGPFSAPLGEPPTPTPLSEPPTPTPPSTPPSTPPAPAPRVPAGPPSGLRSWLRSKALEYAIRGVDVSEVAPGIRPGGGGGNRPVPAEIGETTVGPAQTSTPRVQTPPSSVSPARTVTPSAPSAPATGTAVSTPAPATAAPGVATGPSVGVTQIGQMIDEATKGLSQPGSQPLDPDLFAPAAEPVLSAESARLQLQGALLPLAQQPAGGMIGVINVQGVNLHDVEVSWRGPELQVGYFGIERVTAPTGAGREIQEALEQATVAVAQQLGAPSARVLVRTVVNAQWREFLLARGYHPYQREHATGFENLLAKLFAISQSTPTPSGSTPGGGSPGGAPPSGGVPGGGAPGGGSSTPGSSTPSGSTPGGSTSTFEPSTPSGATAPRNISGSTISISVPSPSRTVKPSSLSRPSPTTAAPVTTAFTPPGPHRVLDANDYDATSIKEGANRGKLLLTHKATGQKFLFKPRSGEVDIIGGNVGIVPGERYRRAPAAAYLAREAGIPTPAAEIVIWRAGGTDAIGSLQEWVTEGQAASKLYGRPVYRTIVRSQFKLDLDAFDYVIANMDRNPGNWKVVLDPQTDAIQRVIPIDMDASLPPGPGRYSLGRVYTPYQPAMPATISRGLYDRLLQMSANRATIEQALQAFLGPAEIQGVFTRLDELLASVRDGHIQVVSPSTGIN